MSLHLKSDAVKVTIEKPGEHYTGSRFDWNGTVTQLSYKNIQLLGEEKPLFKRNKKIYGRGLHNEFGIKDCIGYDCEVGGFFPKIGTGWLKKDENPYFFYTPYEMEKIRFEHEKLDRNKAVFKCFSGERNGYAYEYEKTIEVGNSFVTIDYLLENTGDKVLSTTEYCHNFFCPSNRDLDNKNSLSLSWFFDEDKIQNKESICGFCAFDGQNESGGTLYFTGTPKSEFYLSGLYDAKLKNKDENAPFSWTLRDSKKEIQISEVVSFIPYACDIWGHKKCISPEFIFKFSVEKGDTLRWQRRFDLNS
ncbi:MAG TPA: hypothetical protein PLV89_07390 [Treponemataceae bacterium]|nr:hypothetical protein [Treponemataceae bacterium]